MFIESKPNNAELPLTQFPNLLVSTNLTRLDLGRGGQVHSCVGILFETRGIVNWDFIVRSVFYHESIVI